MQSDKPIIIYPTERHIEAETAKARNLAKARRNWRFIYALIAAAILWAVYVHGLHDGREYMAEIACRK